MKRPALSCDFCGCPEPLIPYQEPGFCWYACPACTQLIQNQEWEALAESCLEAFDSTRLSSSDKSLLAEEAQALVTAFRECLLIPAC